MISVLHNIRSLHNVGSMFRTADAAGIEKIYLTGYTPSPINKLGEPIPQFKKVSLGAEESVKWEKTKDLGKLIKKLKKEGYKIIALEQSPNSIPYDSLITSRYPLIAVIVGNEVRGLSKQTLDKCDYIVEIPMSGKKESLNVSVAYGIAVFEFLKR